MASGISAGNTHIEFDMADGSFYGCTYIIEGKPVPGIPLDSREHAGKRYSVVISFLLRLWVGCLLVLIFYHKRRKNLYKNGKKTP